MNDVIIISGPTAVGKTSLSIQIAKQLNTEIISADSMQIYKHMDIGTAKIKDSEMDGIKHHLIDIIEPDENYSVHDFQKSAYRIIEEMLKNNKIPVIVGGTGLYIDSLIYDYDFINVKPDYELRKKLEEEYSKNPQTLLDKVYSINYENYSHLNIKDKKKLIRAIEVFEKSGKLINYDREKSIKDINYHLFVLTNDRKIIYDRINKRVDIMIESGLIDEVKSLLEDGVDPNSQSMKAIGYREVISYLNNEYTYEEMIDKLKQNSRHYAKRQLTWFRRNEYSQWLDVSKYNENKMIKYILSSVND
ncbi:tRNA (adenosine(37)-N6)-dimethylallyltransferase MiaA [Helcococcus kunzii]|uniref:tRNA (adenosine(37)-N6)-dimethylallyltransferase MiaA n=1 Tax=Helcococcus kunzii TaxID=40091 RepID=UPI001BB045AF|nr:tRNA (adenosine(37)-N6)-dimethylallyltransferase MiaA [Helcococcus kunzii]MCT1795460.1 tRNA (adenosine(37)-N6)-dimethylallyltransferase MiaA [Helcococcus kunzii]MCT1989604.1 tRNA (adenosine(37)-N6)-dimethylallyltransferase MiaA [Helcococcus kunzii]QUY64706.1 tRNA (adenosine(37)-N6)-dimethylallyltransferase MiaA [Helcococcus kunzii]QZO77115.1 tRNA (adenosine(37)-N6)-dimethylallyltransferase MiaA [Helcococcus kunzii]